ncbi:Hypothetical_protein [Hexamita inflata]|uniref:Hypothetical_protein n=1 Tax=Hexamita inflata TaxID=28002 RepID=A0AA86PSM4_9EUKA|nr:Hypothetical protein HINF_LOCUS27907 [Hexamita inflata]
MSGGSGSSRHKRGWKEVPFRFTLNRRPCFALSGPNDILKFQIQYQYQIYGLCDANCSHLTVDIYISVEQFIYEISVSSARTEFARATQNRASAQEQPVQLMQTLSWQTSYIIVGRPKSEGVRFNTSIKSAVLERQTARTQQVIFCTVAFPNYFAFQSEDLQMSCSAGFSKYQSKAYRYL